MSETSNAIDVPSAQVAGDTLTLSGDLTIDVIASVPTDAARDVARIVLDGVTRFDTAGAWLVVQMSRREGEDAIEVSGATPAQAKLIETVRDIDAPPQAAPERRLLRDGIVAFGHAIWDAVRDLLELTAFFGRILVELGRLLRHPGRARLTPLVYHMQAAGLNAAPIVTLMSLLIGVVVAFQGSAQLERFGAEIFVVDLIAISILRELGILLTAIIVAGRSASAFTAAIGSMKMREEVDALRILGLDPVTVLVLPRILALVLTLPILAILADVAGLAGGAAMAWIDLGITPRAFVVRIADGTSPWHLAVGLIKAPVFALIIGLVGCRNGLEVGGDADSLGRLTSSSVVTSIFLVIAADAVFSIFFALLGV
ncbi:putative phospholipid ABC transporter permease protein MlaE [Jannaschia seosinensis]|uniref:Putative phospholipid ABC transporter permease protein MlaE n=1 Tax=Jannaschia seosinensis TaxID=313367 RepID=A0A0M7B976_9RHOB|nr:ABC transporter permease [Jannaschia seosinensis]CUH34977.1 putative phospholipid ABC transporter permease protein MlaE [Jannaschia seosinensis]